MSEQFPAINKGLPVTESYSLKIYETINNGRESDREAAQLALDDPTKPINCHLLRRPRIDALSHDYYSGTEVE